MSQNQGFLHPISRGDSCVFLCNTFFFLKQKPFKNFFIKSYFFFKKELQKTDLAGFDLYCGGLLFLFHMSQNLDLTIIWKKKKREAPKLKRKLQSKINPFFEDILMSFVKKTKILPMRFCLKSFFDFVFQTPF